MMSTIGIMLLDALIVNAVIALIVIVIAEINAYVKEKKS